jgi:hypothetical protein
MTLGEIEALFRRLKSCPLSDNSVDYLEREVLRMTDEAKVEEIMNGVKALIDSHPRVSSLYGPWEGVNEWDKAYDKFLRGVLNKAE